MSIITLKKKIINYLFLMIAHNIYAMNIEPKLSPALDRKCYLIAKYIQTKETNRCETDFLKQEKQSDSVLYANMLKQVACYKKKYKKIVKEAGDYVKFLPDNIINIAYIDYCNLSDGARYEVAFQYRNTPFAILINEGHDVVCQDVINEISAYKIAGGCSDRSEVDVKGFNVWEEDMLAVYRNLDAGLPVVNAPDQQKKESKSNSSLENIKAILAKNRFQENLTIQMFMAMASGKGQTLIFEVHDESKWRSYDRRSWDFWSYGDDQNKKRITIGMGLDFFLKTRKHKVLLDEICKGSTQGFENVDKRYAVTI